MFIDMFMLSIRVNEQLLLLTRRGYFDEFFLVANTISRSFLYKYHLRMRAIISFPLKDCIAMFPLTSSALSCFPVQVVHCHVSLYK